MTLRSSAQSSEGADGAGPPQWPAAGGGGAAAESAERARLDSALRELRRTGKAAAGRAPPALRGQQQQRKEVGEGRAPAPRRTASPSASGGGVLISSPEAAWSANTRLAEASAVEPSAVRGPLAPERGLLVVPLWGRAHSWLCWWCPILAPPPTTTTTCGVSQHSCRLRARRGVAC